MKKSISMFLAVVTLSLATACGPAPTSAPTSGDLVMSEAAVQADAAQLLTGYNDADYAVFTAKWAPAMKAAISEATFKQFQAATMQSKGRFLGLGAPAPAMMKRADLEGWQLDVQFEKGTWPVLLGYLRDGGGIDAVVFQTASK